MMPPTYHNRQAKPSAENAALTVVARGAPRDGSDETRSTIGPARRASSRVSREDVSDTL
jgi:hypothetical protein